MYPNYPHDDYAQHTDICMRAVEGDQSHLRIQRGTVTLNLTANTQLNNNVLFSPVFTPSTTPDVYTSLSSVGTISAKINVVASNPTDTGFTLEAYTDVTQTITVKWWAVGKAE